GGDRSLAAQSGERQRAPRVDLADPRYRTPRAALLAEALRRRRGEQSLDESDRIGHAGLLHEQAFEQIDARVELTVDRRDDGVDRDGLPDKHENGTDRDGQGGGDRSRVDDGRDQVDDT